MTILSYILVIVGWELGRFLIKRFRNKKRISLIKDDSTLSFSCDNKTTKDLMINRLVRDGWMIKQ
jgi:hypothetical protein